MKKLIQQTAILTISSGICKFFAMLFFVILARSLIVSDYGLFRYLMSLAGIYGLFFAGINIGLAKFLGENKKDKKIVADFTTNAFWLTGLLLVLISIIIILFEKNAIYLILFLFTLILDSLYTSFARGLLNYIKLSWFKLVENIIQLAILIVSYLIYQKINFSFAVIFFCFSGLISLFIFERIKPELILKLRLSKEHLAKLAKYAIPVTLGSVGWTIMFGINAIFINKFYGLEQVGYFSVGETTVQIFSFLPLAISTLMLPKIAGIKNKEKLIKPLIFSIAGSLVFSIILLLPILYLKNLIIGTIFTDKYLYATAVILPLSIAQIAISLHQIYSSAWQGLNRPDIPSIIISIACVLNIAGSYVLTQAYGIVGAAVSNAITSILALIITAVLFHTKWKKLSKK